MPPSDPPAGSRRPLPAADDACCYAVVLHLDELSERRVRQVWEALDDHGVPSMAASQGAGYRPHITLAIVGSRDPESLAARLRGPLSDVAGLPVLLSALGFFLTDRAPAYLAVAPTRPLLEVHERVHAEVDAAAGTAHSWPYYRPGTWMPHCTLAMDVVSPGAVPAALGEGRLPIRATVGSAFLTELPEPGPAPTGIRPTARPASW